MMASADVEVALRVLNSSLSQIKWRIKPSSKRRLETDILALCSGMRPLVMVDYGGKMPELQDQLCSLLKLIAKECTIFPQLRVMVIEDMIYLLNVMEFSKYVARSLSLNGIQYFVDLECDPPKIISADFESSNIKELVSVQRFFSSVFTLDGVNDDVLQGLIKDHQQNAKSSSEHLQSLEAVDLSSCVQNYQITIPTLNGWLLGYLVVYLFDKDHISDAIYNLSTKPLHLYKVLVHRSSPMCSRMIHCKHGVASLLEPWPRMLLSSFHAWWMEGWMKWHVRENGGG